MPRAKGIQIYLKPGIEEDDILLNLWDVCKTRARPQEMFRRILQKGLLQMIAQKEISDSILEEVGYVKNIQDFEEIHIVEKVSPQKITRPTNNTLPNKNIEKTKPESLNKSVEAQISDYVAKTNTESDAAQHKEKPIIGKDLM